MARASAENGVLSLRGHLPSTPETRELWGELGVLAHGCLSAAYDPLQGKYSTRRSHLSYVFAFPPVHYNTLG